MKSNKKVIIVSFNSNLWIENKSSSNALKGNETANNIKKNAVVLFLILVFER